MTRSSRQLFVAHVTSRGGALWIGCALFWAANGCAAHGSTSGTATGVAGSGQATSSSQSVTSSVSTTGQGGGGTLSDAPPYPVVFAHGFFGFQAFAGQSYLTYFYQVKDYLAAHGETSVFTPAVDPFNDSTFRGGQLSVAVAQIRASTGKSRVILIGHSQGGLDARVVAHDHPDWVAAVVTLAAPHGGTPVADVGLKLLGDPNAAAIINQLVNLIGAPLYDQIGNQTAITKPLQQFSQPGIMAFNASYPDAPGVFYASLAGRSNLSFGGQGCAPDVALPFVQQFDGTLDPLNALFSAFDPLMTGAGGTKVFVHDGLVRAVDAHHGQFWGCVPADHLDEIGQVFGQNPGLGNNWDYKAFYLLLVTHMRELGY